MLVSVSPQDRTDRVLTRIHAVPEILAGLDEMTPAETGSLHGSDRTGSAALADQHLVQTTEREDLAAQVERAAPGRNSSAVVVRVFAQAPHPHR